MISSRVLRQPWAQPEGRPNGVDALGSRIDDILAYSGKSHLVPRREASRYRLKLLITLLLIAYSVSACSSRSSKQLYENPHTGVSLEKPGNWDLAYFERSGTIVLEAESGIRNRGSARIEVIGGACHDTMFATPEEDIEAEIGRVRILYDLDSVTVVQEPTRVETGGYEVTRAIIAIPTLSLPEDAVENEVGVRGPDVFQTIELLAIRDSNRNFIMAYVYRGNNDELNAEAEEIVGSIRTFCSTEQ
ncbi:MAG TPA: hypothetical protein VJ123_08985 [Anaerolineales bacterium]|nr:hypothetical protein [Anaerolineales bacterium]